MSNTLWSKIIFVTKVCSFLLQKTSCHLLSVAAKQCQLWCPSRRGLGRVCLCHWNDKETSKFFLAYSSTKLGSWQPAFRQGCSGKGGGLNLNRRLEKTKILQENTWLSLFYSKSYKSLLCSFKKLTFCLIDLLSNTNGFTKKNNWLVLQTPDRHNPFPTTSAHILNGQV